MNSLRIKKELDIARADNNKLFSNIKSAEKVKRNGDPKALREIFEHENSQKLRVGSITIDGETKIFKGNETREFYSKAAKIIQKSGGGGSIRHGTFIGHGWCVGAPTDCGDITLSVPLTWLPFKKHHSAQIQLSLASYGPKVDDFVAATDSTILTLMYASHGGSLCSWLDSIGHSSNGTNLQLASGRHLEPIGDQPSR